MKNILFLVIVSFGLILNSCKKEDDVVPEEENIPWTLVNDFPLSGTENFLRIYSEESDWFVGYNRIYFQVLNKEKLPIQQDFTFKPMPKMEMGSMAHGAPVEVSDSKNKYGLYPCDVIYTMASGQMNKWVLEITVSSGSWEGKCSVNPVVKESSRQQVFSFLSKEDSTSMVLTVIEPREPLVGVNDLEIIVHRKESMMSFLPVPSLTFEMDVTMPAMGHGSPGNLAPASTGNGKYKGKVNFTMSGNWEVSFVLKNNQMLIKDDLIVKYSL